MRFGFVAPLWLARRVRALPRTVTPTSSRCWRRGALWPLCRVLRTAPSPGTKTASIPRTCRRRGWGAASLPGAGRRRLDLVRAAILAPGWWPGGDPGARIGRPAPIAAARPLRPRRPIGTAAAHPGRRWLRYARFPYKGAPYKGASLSADAVSLATPGGAEVSAEPQRAEASRLAEPPAAATAPLGRNATPPRFRQSGATPWSGSAWLLLRDDRARATLAPGGTLGGSQAGARLLYRIGPGLALSGRAYAPLRRLAGAEAAPGSTGARRRDGRSMCGRAAAEARARGRSRSR